MKDQRAEQYTGLEKLFLTQVFDDDVEALERKGGGFIKYRKSISSLCNKTNSDVNYFFKRINSCFVIIKKKPTLLVIKKIEISLTMKIKAQ